MEKEQLIELLKDTEIKDQLVDILKDYFVRNASISNVEIIENSQDEEKNNLELLIKEKEEEIEEMGKILKKIKELLGVSEKSEIEDKIIGKNKELKDLIEKKKELELELESFSKKMNKEKEKLTSEINQIKEELGNAKEDVKKSLSKNTELSKTVDFYREKFEKDLKAYSIYTGLSDNTKDSLKGIFRDNSLEGFIACGIQEKNISSLWDYIKDEIREEKNSDIKNLKEMFYFLFEKYRLAFPIFELQEISIGDNFVDDNHIRHSSSKEVNGAISEVVFRGWVNNKTNKAVKKSVVKMG